MQHTRNLILTGTALFLFGCETTSLDTEEAARAKIIISKSCIISSTDGSGAGSRTPGSEKKISDDLTITSITYGEGGWVRSSSVGQGIRGTVYYNIGKKKVFCGQESWRKSGYSFVEATKANYTTEAKSPDSASSEMRSLAVKWEGYPHLIASEISLAQISGGGGVQITLPNNEGHCKGNFSYTGNQTGLWSLTCSNGMAATGKFIAFGEGKGSKGVGKDTTGRVVEYTLGPAR